MFAHVRNSAFWEIAGLLFCIADPQCALADRSYRARTINLQAAGGKTEIAVVIQWTVCVDD